MKTIEEQAAEFSKFDSATDIGTDLGSYRQGLFEGFLAGYKAAQDQVADVSKVMPQWVSVKDRLPEIPDNNYSNRVLLFRADGFIVIARIEKCVRFVRPLEQALIVETDNGDPIEEFTHWMPLPGVEGLKHED